jgi:hypothetical protein
MLMSTKSTVSEYINNKTTTKRQLTKVAIKKATYIYIYITKTNELYYLSIYIVMINNNNSINLKTRK